MANHVAALLNGPGSAAYSPALTEPDGYRIPAQRITHLLPSSGERFTPPTYAGRQLAPPVPSIGGEPGVPSQLGWTDGFRKVLGKLHRPLRGAVVTVAPMGVHPNVGPVGYSTRADRLRARYRALTTDYTPNGADVARTFVGD